MQLCRGLVWHGCPREEGTGGGPGGPASPGPFVLLQQVGWCGSGRVTSAAPKKLMSARHWKANKQTKDEPNPINIFMPNDCRPDFRSVWGSSLHITGALCSFIRLTALQTAVSSSWHTIPHRGLQPEIWWKVQPSLIINALFYFSTAQHDVFPWREGDPQELQTGSSWSSEAMKRRAGGFKHCTVDIVCFTVVCKHEGGCKGQRWPQPPQAHIGAQVTADWNPEVFLAGSQFETHSSHPGILEHCKDSIV